MAHTPSERFLQEILSLVPVFYLLLEPKFLFLRKIVFHFLFYSKSKSMVIRTELSKYQKTHFVLKL